MIVESIAILVIIALILALFVRERRFEYARTAAILAIVPAAYLLSFFTGFACNRLFGGAPRLEILLVGIIVGLTLSSIMVGLMVYHIKKTKLKIVYAVTNGVFIFIVGILMIFDTLQRTFK